MSKGVLLILSLLIILIAGVSIYINQLRHPVKVRIINLRADRQDVNVTVNTIDLPYELAYGTSSEYISLPDGMKNVDLVIRRGGDEFIYDSLELSADSLNTLIIFDDPFLSEIVLINTPFTMKRNGTALRYLQNPALTEKPDASLTGEESEYLLNPDQNMVSEYKLLTEGTYYIRIRTDDEELHYRVFLENNEYYTLVVLPDIDGNIQQLRVFVDNLPGDQFIIPAAIR